MLSGQVISAMDSIIISITGLCIVMTELGLLALFVLAMSKVLAPFGQKAEQAKKVQTAPNSGQVPSNQTNSNEDEDELAAIMAVVCEESGFRPEEIVIKSIQEIR